MYTPNNRSVKLEGFAELEQQLLQLGEIGRADLTARNTLTKAVKLAMEPVYNYAIAAAPKDTHKLEESIRIDARIPTARDKLSDYVNDTDAFIGVVSAKKSAVSLSQEFGNARTPMHPFLRPALDYKSEEVLNILKRQLGSFITDYAAKLNRRRK